MQSEAGRSTVQTSMDVPRCRRVTLPPAIIHKLTYRRRKHDNIHVRG